MFQQFLTDPILSCCQVAPATLCSYNFPSTNGLCSFILTSCQPPWVTSPRNIFICKLIERNKWRQYPQRRSKIPGTSEMSFWVTNIIQINERAFYLANEAKFAPIVSLITVCKRCVVSTRSFCRHQRWGSEHGVTRKLDLDQTSVAHTHTERKKMWENSFFGCKLWLYSLDMTRFGWFWWYLWAKMVLKSVPRISDRLLGHYQMDGESAYFNVHSHFATPWVVWHH